MSKDSSSSFKGGGINIVARAGETPGVIIIPPGDCRDGVGYPNNTGYGHGACGYNSIGGNGAVLIDYSAYVSCGCK